MPIVMTDNKQCKLHVFTMDDGVALDRFQVNKLLTRAVESVKLMFRVLPDQAKKKEETRS